ncbi:hypothetical protein [Clostridium botulinum]|uniref:hypothetical protein n=1 Tax=Clostridium botulinum TaxID=1491 RepID=UPI0012B6A7C4|nr:hypothetical protein [Clostridium botulinum]
MIKTKDYKKIILDWTSNKRKLKEKEEDLIQFFENGFKNTNTVRKSVRFVLV